MFVNTKKLLNMKVVLWPSGWCKDVLRCPEDKFQARLSIATDTEIVKVLFRLRDFVYRLDRSYANIVLPDPDIFREVAGLGTG